MASETPPLRQRFITKDGFTGSQYQDGVAALLPDRSSLAWKTWTAHGNALLNAYEIIVKDGKSSKWPELNKDVKGKAGRKRGFLADECIIAGKDIVHRKDGTTGEDKLFHRRIEEEAVEELGKSTV
ncbi:hypothetical protein B0H10DRAFT_1966602 [Mycena sp. CBHHK59/15]|nr:hypothetical protein B0H10DRAFT_1966602 [Mycena sp. CBHHK59/15]